MNRLGSDSRTVLVVTLALAVIALSTVPSWAGGHTRVVIGVGPGWWGPYPYWWGPYPYAWGPYPYGWYGPPYAYYPPPVIVQEPPVYVQKPAPPEPADGPYWYYCPSAQAYYPSVPACPEAWIKVPPRP